MPLQLSKLLRPLPRRVIYSQNEDCFRAHAVRDDKRRVRYSKLSRPSYTPAPPALRVLPEHFRYIDNMVGNLFRGGEITLSNVLVGLF